MKRKAVTRVAASKTAFSRRKAVKKAPRREPATRDTLTYYSATGMPKPENTKFLARDCWPLLKRSVPSIQKHASAGEMLKPDLENCYLASDLFGLIAKLWDMLADERKERVVLSNKLQAAQEREQEPRLAASIELARSRRRENDIAEGLLLRRSEALAEVGAIASIVKDGVHQMAERIIMRLGLGGRKESTLVEDARRQFLRDVASAMLQWGKRERSIVVPTSSELESSDSAELDDVIMKGAAAEKEADDVDAAEPRAD